MFRVFALAVLALLAPLEGGGVMFAAKQIFLGRSAKAAPTARSYVQDGLIALWDGIENAGWGVHDAAATKWKNLTGDSAWDMSVPAAWLNGNSLYMDGTWNAIGPTTNLTQLSIEVVSSGYSEKNGGAFCAGWSRAELVIRPSFLITRSLCRVYVIQTFDPSLPSDSDCTSTVLTFGPTSTTAYSGGVFNKSSNLVLSSGTTPNRFRLGGYGDASDRDMSDMAYYYKGYIYRCAIYSRALTADEIAANYAIDKERFNLP